MNVFDLFDFDEIIQVMDIGASAIGKTPIYKGLLDKKIAHLTAFDGDERQIQLMKDLYGADSVSIHNHFVFDGGKHNIYLCKPKSGMTSLFKPKSDALAFFNGFPGFGEVQEIDEVQTTRLDDVDGINPPDFLKMDIQGAELGVLQNGTETLKDCLAMQLEVSYFPLYEDQPSFGEIDICLRDRGFVPHRFIDVKRWSIAPTIFKGNFRHPGNQLLESDIIYIKDPLKLDNIDATQLQKLAILAHYAFGSVDLCAWFIIEMEKRGLLDENSRAKYLRNVGNFT